MLPLRRVARTRRSAALPRLASAVLLLLGAACSREPEAAGPLPANGRPVVLISIDSLRADFCSAYGHRSAGNPEELTTPFLDRVAAEGVCFDQAEAASSWTLPSHVSLLTGMNCLEHGVRNRLSRLDPEAETLAARFHRAGYRTAGFYSAPFLHPAWGFGKGFETYVGAAPYLQGLETVQTIADPDRSLGTLHEASHEDARCSERVVDAALAWLAEEDHRQQPFFLFLHLWDPHYDYLPPPEYADLFWPEGLQGPREFRGFDRKPWGEEMLPRLQALYEAEIRYTDDQIARLWSRLEEWGLADRVVLAITADHGDEFLEHGGRGHQKTLYEEVTRIPMVLRAPGAVPAGQVVAAPAALYDLAPTLLGLAGIPSWTDRAGRDLRPLWEDPEAGGHDVLMDLYMPRGSRMWAWRQEDRKFVWDLRRKQGMLFDLARDPGESEPRWLQSPLADPFSRAGLEEFRRWESAPHANIPMQESAGMTALLSELGYVEEGPERGSER